MWKHFEEERTNGTTLREILRQMSRKEEKEPEEKFGTIE